jgi:hypothetical protein
MYWIISVILSMDTVFPVQPLPDSLGVTARLQV